MTESNAESEWMLPKTIKMAKKGTFVNIRWRIKQKVTILETSKTKD